jgi:hypothetical protein
VNQRPRRRTPIVAAVIAATIVVVVIAALSSRPRTPSPSTPVQPAPPASPSGEQFGVSVNYLFNRGDFSEAEVNRQLQELRRSGATLARTDALWEATEPTAPTGGVHHYRWAFDDTIARTLSENGLQWLPILDYSAPWAQTIAGRDHSPPRLAADYAAYAGAFAARYGPGGTYWTEHPELAAAPVHIYEIWNEPDSAEFWLPAPDAARYADLYLAARAAIDAQQPTARVIVGGLTDPGRFLPAMVAAQPALRGHVDGVAIHPYGRPLVVLSRIRAARTTLTALGMPSLPLYATEFGWTTQPPGALDYAPAQARPGYIFGTLRSLGHLNCGLAAVVLYTWVTPQRNRLNPQDWYGINTPRSDGSTPDVSAFTDGLRAARADSATIRLCPGS